MITPYYDSDGITIYHGDARELLPDIPTVDLVLTDPPYGIAAVWKGGFSAKHGWGNAGLQQETRNAWDAEAPSADLLNAVVSAGKHVCIWGGNYFSLPPSRGWFVWNKPERNFTLAEAELAWTNQDAVIRVYDCHRSDVNRQHPTQKPLRLMKWCITQFAAIETICDPFMGSGTTLRAAKECGHRAIGIEINESYCEIAAQRLSQNVFDFEGKTETNEKQRTSLQGALLEELGC